VRTLEVVVFEREGVLEVAGGRDMTLEVEEQDGSTTTVEVESAFSADLVLSSHESLELPL
jgi:hypothetical protein